MLLATIDKRTRQLASVTLVWIGIAAGATFLFLFNPSDPSNRFFPRCVFRALTGFACPGCGSTRGLHALLHGNVFTAFKFNPLMVLALPFLLYVLLRHTNAVMRGQPINRNRLDAKYIWMLFAGVLWFWIFRNTRFYPFPV